MDEGRSEEVAPDGGEVDGDEGRAEEAVSRLIRSCLSLSLVLGSPLAAAMVVVATNARRAAEVGTASGTGTLVGAGVAMLGSVVGVLLAPDPGRKLPVVLAVVYGILSLVAFAAAVALGCAFIYERGMIR